MNSLFYPDFAALERLRDELAQFFAQIPVVKQVIIFGSFARSSADRWSDLDFVVITARQSDFWQVFLQLERYKTIVYRSPFNPQVVPCGAFVLGNVFADESVFHCLDLNFLSLAQAQQSESLQRFGVSQTLYYDDSVTSSFADDVPVTPAPEHPDEPHLQDGLHFAKKAVKKYLRGIGTVDELRQRASMLRTIMQNYPADMRVSGGNIGAVAQQYLLIADLLLNDESPISSHNSNDKTL